MSLHLRRVCKHTGVETPTHTNSVSNLDTPPAPTSSAPPKLLAKTDNGDCNHTNAGADTHTFMPRACKHTSIL